MENNGVIVEEDIELEMLVMPVLRRVKRERN